MYLEAAERVPGLRFGKIDATAHTVTAEEYDVTGWAPFLPLLTRSLIPSSQAYPWRPACCGASIN